MDKIKRDELAIEECFRRYIRLCPETVLTDSKGYAKEIKDLKAELDSILELKAVGNSEIHTANISDPTGSTAVRRIDLEMQIAIIEHMQHMVEAALNRLSYQHRELLDLFFFKKGMMGYNVQEYADTHYMSIAAVYRERRLALNAFADVYGGYIGYTEKAL